MLPRRIPKPAKRASRWKSPAHRDFVRSHACCNCGGTAALEFAHVRMGSGAGMGQKPDDFRGVALCHDCHIGEQHTRLGEPAFWRDYEARTGQTVDALIAAFCAASPKAGDIRRVQQERGQWAESERIERG